MNGLNAPNPSMFDRLLRRYQVVAVQETKFIKPDSQQSVDYFIHSIDAQARTFWSHSTTSVFNGRHGVGIIFSSAGPFSDLTDVTSEVILPQLLNRYLVVRARLGDTVVYYHVVYAPDEPALRGDYFRSLPTTFPPEALHVVVGDFNVTLDSMLDQVTTGSHHAGEGRVELQDWLGRLGLLDAWRFTNPDKREYTSPSRRNRIDYCFLSLPLLQDNLTSVRHVTDDKWHHEDHVPVEVQLAAAPRTRDRRSSWRCPTWLLRDQVVQEYLSESVTRLADRLRRDRRSNPGCLLDEHKRTDCIFLRERMAALRDNDRAMMSRLVSAVNLAHDQANQCPSDATRAELQRVKQDLAAYQEMLLHRNQYKKFAADVTTSERSSKSFFSAPVPDLLRVPITEVETSDGVRTDDSATIEDAHRQFWGGLFQSTSRDLRHLRNRDYNPIKLLEFLQDTTARLTSQQQAYLDAPLTANDFYWAIMTAKSDKAPGPDGLSIEYYRVDPELWARIFELVYDCQLARGKMSKFQRRAYLSLLHKSGDRAKPSNFRPLTLLNHDAKLGPKILAHRAGHVLPSIIHDDQAGFVAGRSIRHALLRFHDLQQLCKAHHLDAVAVMLDFAKAFDSVLWPALDLVLQHFGFGPTFRDWIRTFYAETSVSILLNDTPSKPFKLGAGVRQGDPLSPALFVILIEPMLNFLRSRISEMGIPVPGRTDTHLLLAFADDCTGLLRDIRNANKFIKLVNEYSSAAGMTLNVNKTAIMPMTHRVNTAALQDLRNSSNFKVLNPSDTIRLLGVLQGTLVTPEQRFEPILSQMRRRCVIWRYRARTLRGRVVILQTIILPLVWFVAGVTPVPPSVFKAVDIIIRNFIHQHTSSTVSLPGKFNSGWIYTSRAQGGLGLVRPQDFVNATHLVCLRDALRHVHDHNTCARWFEPALALASTAQGTYGNGFDFLYAIIPQVLQRNNPWRILPEYWLDTLRLWAKLQDQHGATTMDIHGQTAPLWNNRHFVFGSLKRPLHLLSSHTDKLASLGFSRIIDFVDRFGSFPTRDHLTELLQHEDFARPASKTRFITETLHRLSLLCDEPGPKFGPFRPRELESAVHHWVLQGMAVIEMTNRSFVKLLSKSRSLPEFPASQLHVDATPTAAQWREELKLDLLLLPVAADVKFRLQHNAMGFRYKYKWRPDIDTTCVHHCNVDETALHLFWECRVARYQWDRFWNAFQGHTTHTLEWSTLLFSTNFTLTQASSTLFGRRTFLQVFNIIRCCVMRSLWLHRNKVMFNPEVTSSPEFVYYQARSYIGLHLRLLRIRALKSDHRRMLAFIDQVHALLFPPSQQA